MKPVEGQDAGAPFHFGAVVAEIEDLLIRELALESWPLDPELARAEGRWKGQPAVIETRAYRGSCLRYARFVRLSGPGLDIGNVLCLADPLMPLPILGADLVAVGRETGMVAADLSPTLPPGPVRDAQLGPAAAARARHTGLPTGGDLPSWCRAWFSPHALYTRVRSERAPEAVEAVRDLVRAFVEVARAATPRVESLSEVTAAQEGYAEAHRTEDQGLRLLATMFGRPWAERYVRSVLFPPLDPRSLGWEIALSCDAQGRVDWADERVLGLLDARPGRRFVELVLPDQVEKATRFLQEARTGAAGGWELTVTVCGRPVTLLFRGVARTGGAMLIGSLLPELHRDVGARVAGIASELATLHREAERQRRELADVEASLREALTRERAARAEVERLAAERAAVLGQLAEGVIIADADGRISFANEAAAHLHGGVELGVPIARYAETYHVLTLDGQPYPPEGLPLERQKEELLATIAHDLKNPLAALEMLVEVLQDGTERSVPIAPDRVVDMTRQMKASTNRMIAMVDELFDLARVQMGAPLELRRRPTDLVALARDVVAAQQQATALHRLRVDTQLDAVVGDWDPSRLARVLANLLDNAIKYSPDGGDIAVRISTTESADVRTAVVEVIDRGIGIPQADVGRVFEHFFRSSNVVGRILGTGIGLGGVRDIVERHGGAMTIDSRPGAGTAVSVRLPLGHRDDRPAVAGG